MTESGDRVESRTGRRGLAWHFSDGLIELGQHFGERVLGGFFAGDEDEALLILGGVGAVLLDKGAQPSFTAVADVCVTDFMAGDDGIERVAGWTCQDDECGGDGALGVFFQASKILLARDGGIERHCVRLRGSCGPFYGGD